MWNSEAPLELLKSLPSHLTIENLKNLQQVIDVDKYKNSQRLKRDLCGAYAPFCENCEKWVKYPCAVAYCKMKQAEGMEIEMEVVAADAEEPAVEEVVEEKPEPKKYIRIAIARRKH